MQLQEIKENLEKQKILKLFLNSKEEYFKIREEITKDILKDLEDKLIFINKFYSLNETIREDSLSFDEEVQKGLKSLKVQRNNMREKFKFSLFEVVKISSKFKGLSLFSPHIYTDLNMSEFLKSKLTRCIESEAKWYLSHYEVPYLDQNIIKENEEVKKLLKFLPNLVEMILTSAVFSKDIILNEKTNFIKFIDLKKFLQWNSIYLFKALQNDNIYYYNSKKRDIEFFNNKIDKLVKDVKSGTSIGSGFLNISENIFSIYKSELKTSWGSSEINLKELKDTIFLNLPLSVNPTFFRIFLKDKTNARTLTADFLKTHLFNFDLNYYQDLEKEEAKRLCEFNAKSIFMLLPHLWRQGECHVESSIPKDLRDKRLDKLPVAKKMPILFGKQSIGKTYFLDILNRFQGLVKTGFNANLASTDGKATINSNQIVEYAEINQALFKDSEILKANIGSTMYKQRRFYTQTEILYAFQTLFIATTNNEKFLRDNTGNLRYMIIPLKAKEEGQNKGYALNLNDFWQNENEYINTMISLQEEYFKILNDVDTDFSSKQSLEKRSYFANIYEFELCRIGEDLANKNNTYKKQEELELEEAIMSYEFYTELEEKAKLIAQSVAKTHNLNELKDYLKHNIFGTADRPANFNDKNLNTIIVENLGYNRIRRSVENSYKRIFKYNNEKFLGVIYFKDFYEKLQENS